jgi:hypothetical protein
MPPKDILVSIFVEYPRKVSKLCPSQPVLHYSLGNLEVDDEAASLHRARADAPTIAVPQAGPAKQLVEEILKARALVDVRRRTHAFDLVLDEEPRMVVIGNFRESTLARRRENPRELRPPLTAVW